MKKRILSFLTTVIILLSLNILCCADETELFYSVFRNNNGLSFSSANSGSIGTGSGLLASVKSADEKISEAYATIGNLQWGDYKIETSFEADKSLNSDDRIMFKVKSKSAYNSYAVVFAVQSQKAYICKDRIDAFTTSSYTRKDYTAKILTDRKNDLSIAVFDGNISVVLNGEKVIDFDDMDFIPFGSMSMGVATKGADTFNTKFDFLKVTGTTYTIPKITGTYVGNTSVFNDDFENDLSKWDITGDALISDCDGFNMMKLGNGSDLSEAYIKNENFSDMQLRWYAKSDSDGYSIYTRYVGLNLYYRIDFLISDGGTIKVLKKVNSEEKELMSINNVKEKFGLDLSEFHSLKLVCQGEYLGIYYGRTESQILLVCDEKTGVLSGKTGFVSKGAIFDDISVFTGGSPVSPFDLKPVDPINKANMNDNDEKDNVYAQIYVSTDGDDNNDGSETAPFKTLERATEELKIITPNMTGNVIVNVESGNYELKKSIRIDNTNSGRNDFYVIYKSVGGRSIISGGHKIEGTWTPYKGKIYKIPVESLNEFGFKEFYVNGERKARAGAFEMNPEFLLYSDEDKTYTADGLYISKSLLPSVKHPEDLEWISSIAWRDFHCPVQSMQTSERDNNLWVLKMCQPAFQHAYSIGPDGANTATHRAQRIKIENALELLDEPGEWYYDRHEKMFYYYPNSYEDINTMQCYIPGIDRLIEIYGDNRENHAGNVTFSGFDFCHTGYKFSSQYGYVTNQTPFVKDIDPTSETYLKEMDVEYAVMVQNADNIKFYDNKFTNLGSSAMHFVDAVNNVSITKNVFDDIADSAIVMGHVISSSMKISWDKLNPLDNFYIANNIINDIGSEYSTGIGIITTYATNVWILHNEISNIGLNPISLGWGWAYPATLDLHSNCIMYNILRDYNYKQVVHDLAAVYMLSAQQKSIIAENYFVNDFGGSYGAIYYDQGASYVLSADNVIKDVNASVFILSAERHDNLAINNYTTDPKITNSGTESYVVDLNTVKNYNWPTQAKKIINNAGLTNDCLYLKDYLSEASVCLDKAYKLTGYRNNSSSTLRFGTLMPINNTDSAITAKIINNKLYLPREEIKKVCFTSIPSYLGGDMSYNANDDTVICSFSTNSSANPKILKAPVGSSIWTVDGKSYETDAPVIVENEKAYISVEDVFKCFGIAKTVVYSGDVGAICEKGFEFSFEDNQNVAKYLYDRLGQ